MYLIQEKSKLFAQLKRILETENTKKVNEKKHETQLYLTGGQSGAPNPAIHFLSGTGHMGRPVMFKHAPHHVLPQVCPQIQYKYCCFLVCISHNLSVVHKHYLALFLAFCICP